MIKKNNKLFCIIGVGDHSNLKLLPALLKTGKKIVGLVSRSHTSNIRKFKRFNNIDLALKKLPKETVFLISTPPSSHFYYINILLKNKRDFIVEKPIFTHPSQVIACKKYYFCFRKIVFREAMMYRYTLLYKKTKKFIIENFDRIESITCDFLVPGYSKSTFRDQEEIESSPLYDIGCYIIDFFISVGTSLRNFNVIKVDTNDGRILCIYFSFMINRIQVFSKIGIGNIYVNNITVKNNEGYKVHFEPFFYGRQKRKVIKNEKNDTSYVFYDNNAFIKMFKENPKLSNMSKKINYCNTLKLNKILYILKNQIKNIINVS